METPKHIQRLKDQVDRIDEQIDNLRGASFGTVEYIKILELQELAGKKEAQIKRYEYLHNLRGQDFSETLSLLVELEDKINQYSHVKDEVQDVHQLILAKLQELEDEVQRREEA